MTQQLGERLPHTLGTAFGAAFRQTALDALLNDELVGGGLLQDFFGENHIIQPLQKRFFTTIAKSAEENQTGDESLIRSGFQTEKSLIEFGQRRVKERRPGEEVEIIQSQNTGGGDLPKPHDAKAERGAVIPEFSAQRARELSRDASVRQQDEVAVTG